MISLALIEHPLSPDDRVVHFAAEQVVASMLPRMAAELLFVLEAEAKMP